MSADGMAQRAWLFQEPCLFRAVYGPVMKFIDWMKNSRGVLSLIGTATAQGRHHQTFMKSNITTPQRKLSLAGVVACAVLGPASAPDLQAQELKNPSPETPASQTWQDYIPDLIRNGKVNVNARLRWEHADQSDFGGSSNPKASDAFTIRTRLGFTTDSFYNFKAMLEFEDVTILGNEDNYNQSGLNGGAGDKTVIADPETTEVNRAWLAYENWDTLFKYGRQRIILDNARFVGNVGWRQNEQTFDGITVRNTGLVPDTTLFYSFLHNVNRVVGDDHPAGDWDSENHLVNASYSGWEYGTVTAYSYILANKDSAANSSATYGASFAGSAPVCEDTSVNYRAEYAYQTDYRNNPMDYDANYYHVNLGGKYRKANAGVGYEVLGSDSGDIGFSTPLATLHAFNGWADTFLTTPADGLEDLYFWLGYTLPGTVPVKAVYHHYSAEDGSNDYGHEVDVVASRKFGKHFNLLAKFAWYEDGDDGLAGRTKFWLQGEFNY